MRIAILGRQPHISLAELESLYPDHNVQALNRQAAMLSGDVDISILGGTIKIAEPVVDRKSVEDCLKFIIAYYEGSPPISKMHLGFSYYGVGAPSNFNRQLLSLKKELKNNKVSVRIVNQPKDKFLNTAQVTHNNLLSNKGQEWLIVKKHGLFVVAKTLAVQDIDDFASRDQTRPFRDTKIGMLPPKLARILVNIAVGDHKKAQVLDPFCGTGVVLQEAMIRGFDAVGSDINPAMVHATQGNLQWLKEKFNVKNDFSVGLGDAASNKWPKFSAVAAETYLGPPLSKFADGKFLEKNIPEINALHEQFFKNIAAQAKPGTRMALALPAWAKPGNRFERLPLVDHLEDLGYNLLDFETARRALIYHRDGQYVARDIVVVERK